MFEAQEDVLYYITVMNENYAQPAMPEGARDGILKGMYLLQEQAGAQVQLLGSGTILREVREAARILREDYNVGADVWSVTSWSELRRDGMACERHNCLNPAAPLDFDQRVQAVQLFRQLPEAAALAAANKRVSNLLSKADGAIAASVEAHYFDNPREFTLYSVIQHADHAVQPLAADRRYRAALELLAGLREPVDAFFEEVLVNAEDPAVRANRFALLAKLRGLFLGVADISLLG